jgi:hypothetical protein
VSRIDAVAVKVIFDAYMSTTPKSVRDSLLSLHHSNDHHVTIALNDVWLERSSMMLLDLCTRCVGIYLLYLHPTLNFSFFTFLHLSLPFFSFKQSPHVYRSYLVTEENSEIFQLLLKERKMQSSLLLVLVERRAPAMFSEAMLKMKQNKVVIVDKHTFLKEIQELRLGHTAKGLLCSCATKWLPKFKSKVRVCVHLS